MWNGAAVRARLSHRVAVECELAEMWETRQARDVAQLCDAVAVQIQNLHGGKLLIRGTVGCAWPRMKLLCTADGQSSLRPACGSRCCQLSSRNYIWRRGSGNDGTESRRIVTMAAIRMGRE